MTNNKFLAKTYYKIKEKIQVLLTSESFHFEVFVTYEDFEYK